MSKEDGFRPRVVCDVTLKYRKVIEEFLERLTEGVDVNDSDSILRAMQNLATGSRAALLEFERRMGERYYRAIVRKWRGDVEQLFRAGFLSGFAKNIPEALARLAPLEEAVTAYFQKMHYSVGRSQRFVVPVLPLGYWEAHVEVLRATLEHQCMNAVDTDDRVLLDVKIDFQAQYEYRTVTHRAAPPLRPYALCGVHGGKDTPQYTIDASLQYFASSNRVPFTFMEALSLYTAHPRFLREQERVVLLGERYEGGNYAFISCPFREKTLTVGLVSVNSADAGLAPSPIMPHAFHGGSLPRLYGKPSSAALVACVLS